MKTMNEQIDVCECCLSGCGLRALKTNYSTDGKIEDYQGIILNTFDIFITPHNRNSSICDPCITKLTEAFEFKKLIRNAQETLAKMKREGNSKEYAELEVKRENEEDYAEENPTLEVKVENHSDNDNVDDADAIQIDNEEIKDGGPVKCGGKTETVAPSSSRKKKGTKKTDPRTTTKLLKEKSLKDDTAALLKHSNLCPFKWYKNKYRCFSCKETYTDFSQLRKHTSMHDLKDLTRIVTRFNTVSFHKVDTTDLKCTVCWTTLENLLDLRTHLEKHNLKLHEDLFIPYRLNGDFICVVCNKKYDSFFCLNSHMNVHYKNFICEFCGAGFISESNLREHKMRHAAKQNGCRKCDLDFSNVYQKELHNSTVHSTAVFRRVCPHCPARFPSHYKRLLHLISEHGFKKPEHKCSTCNKTFIRQYLLNCHVRRYHMMEANEKCEVCKKAFFNKYDLKQHSKTHTGEKDNVCTVCGKAYARKSTLKMHMATHK